MYSNRVLSALLFGVGLTVAGAGCAAVDALVSSPAGNAATRSDSSRMAAIGRVFENQGRYAKAQSMYRSALHADPQNTLAKDRLQSIAKRSKINRLKNATNATAEAFAIADDLTSAKKRRFRPTAPPLDLKSIDVAALGEAPPVPAVPETFDPIIASLTPVSLEEEPETPEVAVVTVSSDIGDVDVVETNWELGELAGESDQSWGEIDIRPAATIRDETATIATVGFEGEEEGATAIAATSTEWKSAARLVTLDELVSWMEHPDNNRQDIINAISNGEDDGVRALATAVLVDCRQGDDEIFDALDDARRGDVEIIRVSALDALVQRNEVSEDHVSELLLLLKSEDPAIRTLVATTLRNLSSTVWAPQCVDGLSKMLNDENADVTLMVATTLGDFGADAVSSRESLTQLTAHESDELARAAQLALLRIPVTASSGDAGISEGVTLPPVSSDNIETFEGEFLPVVE